MIRIRQRGKPYEELELQGSRTELLVLRETIIQFCSGREASATIALPSSNGDFSGVGQLIRTLRVCKTEGLLIVSAVAGQLLISGRPQYLEVFARNLPGEATQDSAEGTQVHLDRLGFPSRISEASLGIVLTPE